ncbi:HAD-IA family hydrolase [Rhodobacteraceae bacterium 2CG4]|uniref:phosphoglycolate phosphatase n=1 Tax=Halovulum marinum TaxID=2662447 RepID=A0A6L5YXA6_9RHOB|nr:HAD family hydrolase [Halovulum marinum]MSU88304.1 HAD-IA family hydrolase [Halovulum marinum]
MSEISAILFDKDGTLFDFGLTWGPWTARFIRELARDAAHADALAQAMRFDMRAERHLPDSPFVAGTVDDWMPVLLPLLPEHGAESLLRHIGARAAGTPQVPAAPLPPLLQGLRDAGYRLGVATNDGFAPVSQHLAEAGVAHMFDFVAGYDSGHGPKPAPGMLLAFSRHTGVATDATLMVGDSLHDLTAARTAGMPAVAVLTGSAPAEVLAPHAEAVLPSIASLPDWLKQRKTGTPPSQTGRTGLRMAD